MHQKSACICVDRGESKGVVPPLTRLRRAQLRFGRDDKLSADC